MDSPSGPEAPLPVGPLYADCTSDTPFHFCNLDAFCLPILRRNHRPDIEIGCEGRGILWASQNLYPTQSPGDDDVGVCSSGVVYPDLKLMCKFQRMILNGIEIYVILFLIWFLRLWEQEERSCGRSPWSDKQNFVMMVSLMKYTVTWVLGLAGGLYGFHMNCLFSENYFT